MYAKYKILILPLVVLLIAGSNLFYEKPLKVEKTTFSKAFPFPYKQESKTEWAKPNWSNKISKSISTFISSLIKNKIERPNVFTIIENEQHIFYDVNPINKYTGRAPPSFS